MRFGVKLYVGKKVVAITLHHITVILRNDKFPHGAEREAIEMICIMRIVLCTHIGRMGGIINYAKIIKKEYCGYD
jgi:hypothetical protein